MKHSHQGYFSRHPGVRRSRLGQGLAVAVGCIALCALLLLGPAVHAGTGGGKVPKAPDGYLSPSDCKQDCLDKYLSNQQRCKDIFCDSFLFITLDCDEAGLAQCRLHVEEVFQSCIANCDGPFA